LFIVIGVDPRGIIWYKIGSFMSPRLRLKKGTP
jgi:hypothetical protein